MPTLILTLDYELYGDGSGHVIDNLIRPTERLLEICERHSVPLTIFWEIVEHWRMEEAYSAGESLGYPFDPARLMKDQVVAAYRRGHDVQLHVHPQWLQARYDAGRWQVDDAHWRLPTLPTVPDSGELPTIAELLARGKRTIEEHLRPFDPDYRCRIFRAGYFNTQPSDRVLPALRRAGLEADSSVLVGGKADTPQCRFDYREADPALPHWRTGATDILGRNDSDPAGVIEFPIFAMPMRRYRKLDMHRLRSKLGNKAGARTAYSQGRAKLGRGNLVRYLMQPEAVPWDFCLSSLSKMKRFWKLARQLETASGQEGRPFVLIGHSKDLIDGSSLDRFLSFLRDNDEPIRFDTLSGALDRVAQAACLAAHR